MEIIRKVLAQPRHECYYFMNSFEKCAVDCVYAGLRDLYNELSASCQKALSVLDFETFVESCNESFGDSVVYRTIFDNLMGKIIDYVTAINVKKSHNESIAPFVQEEYNKLLEIIRAIKTSNYSVLSSFPKNHKTEMLFELYEKSPAYQFHSYLLAKALKDFHKSIFLKAYLRLRIENEKED